MNYIKIFVFVVIIVILSALLSINNKGNLNEISKESLSQSKENEDLLITLLFPAVEKAVEDFYEPYLTNNPLVMPYDAKILKIEIDHNYSHFAKYIVTVEVPPFLGPHRYIGNEKIVLNIKASGEVSVKKYEHLRSNEIFPLDKPLFKKPLPRK